MHEDEMERKEALEYISSKINEGQSKQQIYQDLLPKIRYKTDLISYFSEIPDPNARNRNKKLNTFFLFLLFGIIIFQLIISIRIARATTSTLIPWYALGGFSYFLAPIFLIFFLKNIWNFARSGYRWLFLIALINLGFLARDIDHAFIWLLMVPWIAAMGLSVFLLKRVFPYEKLFSRFDQNKFEADLLHCKDGQSQSHKIHQDTENRRP
jgi:hypothetical protein